MSHQAQSREGVFRYHVPPWPLARFVESLYSSYTSAEFVAGLERAERLPEMAAQLVFMLEDGCAYPGARRVHGSVHASLFLQLGHLQRLDIPLSVREVTAASLRPSGLPLVLPGSAEAWTGSELIAFDEILKRPAQELLERLVETKTPLGRMRVLQGFLEQRMRSVVAPHPLVSKALRLTSQSQGALSVTELADRCGCSVRRLHQLAVQTTGLSPKQLARIARAQNLLGVLKSSSSLTDAAMMAGFFDHPHLIRECQALFGCTPSELSEALSRSPALDPVMSTNRQLISTGLALVPRAPAAPLE
jgi:AraC-like DNA-binding protein